MMRFYRELGALIFSALLASVAVAQQAPDAPEPGMPPFDQAIVEACLMGQVGLARQACIGVTAARCMDSDSGSSTVGMSYCLGQELEVWDALMNDAYGAVMEAAERDDAEMAELGSAAPKQAPLLKEMQRQWIAFRDAACDYEASRWGGGTGAGPAAVQCALTQTGRQALWLIDYQEMGQ